MIIRPHFNLTLLLYSVQSRMKSYRFSILKILLRLTAMNEMVNHAASSKLKPELDKQVMSYSLEE